MSSQFLNQQFEQLCKEKEYVKNSSHYTNLLYEPFRGQVVIATKFGFKPASKDETDWSALDSRPEHVKEVGAIPRTPQETGRSMIQFVNVSTV